MTKAQVLALIQSTLQPLITKSEHVLTDEYILDYLDQALTGFTDQIINQVTGITDNRYYTKNQITNILSNIKKGGPEVFFDGGGGFVQAGSFVDIEVPYDCTIQSSTILSESGVTGSVVLDVLTCPSLPGSPTTSIVGSTPPTISSSYYSQDTSLSGWNTTLSEGNVMRVRVVSCSGLYQFTFSLKVVRA